MRQRRSTHVLCAVLVFSSVLIASVGLPIRRAHASPTACSATNYVAEYTDWIGTWDERSGPHGSAHLELSFDGGPAGSMVGTIAGNVDMVGGPPGFDNGTARGSWQCDDARGDVRISVTFPGGNAMLAASLTLDGRQMSGTWSVLDGPYQGFGGTWRAGAVYTKVASTGVQPTLTTDPASTGPTPEQPIQTTLDATNAPGNLMIEHASLSEVQPKGTVQGQWLLLDNVVRELDNALTDPVPAAPLRVTFQLDASALPTGANGNSLAVFRDTQLVADCTTSGYAGPDPCVESRRALAGGDEELAVLTTLGGIWTFATPVPPPVGTQCSDTNYVAEYTDWIGTWIETTGPHRGSVYMGLSFDGGPAGSTVGTVSGLVDMVTGGPLGFENGTLSGSWECADTQAHVSPFLATFPGGNVMLDAYLTHDGRQMSGTWSVLDGAYQGLGGTWRAGAVYAKVVSTGMQSTLTTDPSGTGPTLEQPIQTTLDATNAPGNLVIEHATLDQVAPTGTLEGSWIVLEDVVRVLDDSPNLPTSPSLPLRLTFQLDASALPPGVPGSSVVVFRDGQLLPDCTTSGYAGPDPCVESRRALAGGDAEVVVVTTAASIWSFAMPVPAVTIAPPADIVQGNDPGRCDAVVDYPAFTVTGTPTPTVTASPPSGSSFPVGATPVHVTATNTQGSAEATFTVQVNDVEAPAITAPAPLSVPATAPGGALAAYTFATTDNCPGVHVQSAPSSGSVFPIGDTTVTGTATDTSGHQTSASFVVHVQGAAEQLADLQSEVAGVGVAKTLSATVEIARYALAQGHTAAAVLVLRVFIIEVRAQAGWMIPTAQADELIATATRIITVLGA